MTGFLRLIGFMVFALAVWQIADDVFAGEAANRGNVVDAKVILVHEETDSCVSVPPLPYLPDAELAGIGGQVRLLAYSRIKRFSPAEYIFSLKDRMGGLARRELALSRCRERLYETAVYYRCQPVCEYYIFHTEAYSHLVFYRISLFPLCMVRLCVFAGGYCIFISDKFIKAYYNYGNSNY